MARKLVTKAEKQAFKWGMAAQYNKEHPKYSWAVAEKKTTYDDDGSVRGAPHYGKVQFFKTKKDAEEAVARTERVRNWENKQTMDAVKKKHVTDHYETSVPEIKHIKPTRDVDAPSFENLKNWD